jgi:UDP-glucuronate 4-epimerase
VRLLVTGGAGFIGSTLVDALVARGDEVIILDHFDDFYRPELKRLNLAAALRSGRATLVEGDICNPIDVTLAFSAKPEVVVHLAARAGVRPSIEQPELYARVNVMGTSTVLEAARHQGTRLFVFGSSSSVYGARSEAPFSENDRTDRPMSPYAATKIAGEMLCAAASSLGPTQCVALRFFTVYGPRQRPDLAIAKFARLMLAGQPIPFFGSGESARDYTFVDDIVGGILAATEKSWPEFECINLGGAHPISLSRLVEAIQRALGVRAILDRQPDQVGDVPLTAADVRKAEERLGWRPRISLEEGLERYAAWVREEPNLRDQR